MPISYEPSSVYHVSRQQKRQILERIPLLVTQYHEDQKEVSWALRALSTGRTKHPRSNYFNADIWEDQATRITQRRVRIPPDIILRLNRGIRLREVVGRSYRIINADDDSHEDCINAMMIVRGILRRHYSQNFRLPLEAWKRFVPSRKLFRELQGGVRDALREQEEFLREAETLRREVHAQNKTWNVQP